MNRFFLILIYSIVLLFIFFSFTFGRKLIVGERLIKYENAAASKQDFMKKYEKKFDLTAKIIVGSALIFMLFYFIFPAILDIPVIVTGKYSTIIGNATSNGYAGNRAFPKSVNIKDSETGEIIQLHFYSLKNIKIGDQLKLEYLPHSKYATLIKQS
ncbi:hypothetical protein IGJ55_003318 [Enterococcus sp. AZ170]|uniref:hypothetical protein n=1 Tax=Enterococcus sp. AZ170 TaxID=2774747 RepID=UPI003D2F9FFD